MSQVTTLRTKWHCWVVAHGGDGPGRLQARDVVKRSLGSQSPLPIAAEEAAELYAQRHYNDALAEGDFLADEWLVVGAAAERGGEAVGAYQCSPRLSVAVMATLDPSITAEALRP